MESVAFFCYNSLWQVKIMSKYLTVCDLDESLLTRDKKIKRKSIKFIHKYINKGNYFILCTGRPYSGMIRFYNTLKINMPFITDNGASIYYPDGKSIRFDIDKDRFITFLKTIDEAILSGISTVDRRVVMQNSNDIPFWIKHFDNVEYVKEGKLSDLISENPILPNLWLYEDKIELFEKEAAKYTDLFAYRNWGLYEGKWSIEIFSPNASKGLAMQYLAKELGIDEDKTCAFGDQRNDLSMIEMAHYGVAMINAVDELKQAAKYQTKKDNNHNGVVHFIKKNKLF